MATAEFMYSVSFVLFVGLLGRPVWKLIRQKLQAYQQSIEERLESAENRLREAIDHQKEAIKTQAEEKEAAQNWQADNVARLEGIKLQAQQEQAALQIQKKHQLTIALQIEEEKFRRHIHTTALKQAIEATEAILVTHATPELHNSIVKQSLEFLKK